MLQDPVISKPARIKSNKFIVYSRVIVLSLAILALAGSPSETASVHAVRPVADGALDATLTINISGGGTYCMGKDYQVSVTPRLGGGETTDTAGTKHQLVEIRTAAVAIEAFSTNTSVATISPRNAVSGWDVTGYDVSAAMFNLHANKAGSTRIYFEASIRGQYVGPGVDIKVIPCKYRVTMNITTMGQIPNITETAIYSAKGELAGEGTLTGNATVRWNTKQASACFVTTQKAPASSASLEGSMSGEGSTLTLHATFAATTVTNSVRFTCGYGAASTKQLPFQPPAISVTLPAAGGTKSQQISAQIGGVTLNGRANVTVTPIEAK